MMESLIIVDAQYDFMPGGALGVTKGDEIIPIINRIIGKFSLVVAIQDWHPKNHLFNRSLTYYFNGYALYKHFD